MKYQLPVERIPQKDRKEINEKILYLIDSNTCKENDISQQDIFSSFTGKGSLHDLNFSDFDNRYEFSEAKKIEEVGQFFTPAKICKYIVDCVKPNESDLVADLTFGMGNFFNFCPNEFNCYGTELDVLAYKVARFLYPNSNLVNDDIRLYNPKTKFDIVFGNPPFGLRWKAKSEEYLSQFYYFLKSAEFLKPAGLLAVIAPSSFLADDFMDKKRIELVNQDFNFILQIALPKNAFRDVGVASHETKIMFFQKKSEHLEDVGYSIETKSVVLTDASATAIHQEFIKPVLDEKKKIHAKLLLENLSQSADQKEFQYKVKKLLFDVKNSKHTKDKYAKASDYVNEFYTQVKPEGMEYPEWEKIRITENKVLSYLKKILKNQHIVERDEIRLVKDNYGLRLKAYSRKSKIQLNKMDDQKKESFNNMVLYNAYPFKFGSYRKLVNKKIAKFSIHQTKFKDIAPEKVKPIEDWIEANPIFDYTKNQSIVLTETQKKDAAAMIYKGGILDWEQGSGKSLAAIMWYRYHLSKVRNVFVLGPAIAIKLTWDVILTDYRENYTMIDSLEKIDHVKPGQIVLISYDMLRKYERQIKRFIKLNCQKIALVVDESDEMTNYNSKRTQVVRNCFRKVAYKLLTTGTTTRNNINELYSQLELLYNNSINMVCTCEHIYKFDKKEDKIVEVVNDFYMEAFPAYYGNGLFKSCFSPYKQTVFGIKKHNQDVFNSSNLVDLIERTIITRSFFDITGKKPQFEVVRVKQNPAEEHVYDIIVNEFFKMVGLFKKTANPRKDSMLKIIRQIQLLIKATSIPQKFKEYNSTLLPNKQNEIFSLVEKYSDEKVAIGCIFKHGALDYFGKLKSKHSDREAFLITGDVPFKERKKIIAAFESTKNGILVSTQQSLKSSVNIPNCDKVIIETLMWNLPKISQYYMRFVRFNSIIENKKIIFVVYENTIEMNLLALLMDKQRINEFIKNLNFKGRENIFADYGIDFNLIDLILERVSVNENGKNKVKIAWGKQKIG